MSILRIKNQETGEWESIPVIVGPQGPAGEKGEKGDKGDTGATGPQGEKGDTGAAGSKGADGYTPVKGVDYYTDLDKTEMVNAVIAALPVYNGEVV